MSETLDIAEAAEARFLRKWERGEMHVLLSTYWLHGDVEPMMGLAVQLQTLGAEVWV